MQVKTHLRAPNALFLTSIEGSKNKGATIFTAFSRRKKPIAFGWDTILARSWQPRVLASTVEDCNYKLKEDIWLPIKFEAYTDNINKDNYYLKHKKENI